MSDPIYHMFKNPSIGVSQHLVFTQPWTISYNAFNRAADNHILYKYACHEGNARNLKLMTGTDTAAAVSLEHVAR